MLASEKNLSAYPVRISRYVLFAALVLLRIMWSPYATKVGLMNDKVKQVIRVRSCAIRMPDDHISSSCQMPQSVLPIKDEGRVPLVQTRMSASIAYDAIRVHNEQLQQNNASDMLTPLDLNGLIWQDFEKTL
ncbi:hypothetical protein FQN53_004137 [Emmonsiellopsis sp. PD_33]|nr:hypothetical protein FQN53_004137 [Emmonsiellopsis sp. PD_33]